MLCGVAALFIVGCSDDSDVQAFQDITIFPAITRVSELDFETDDQIGLTITRASGLYVDNVRMSYDGSVFKSSDVKWYATGESATFTAYYPYAEAGAPTQFRVAADQSAGCEASDLLVAVKENVTPSSAAVAMLFRHVMSAVKLSVSNRTSSAVSEITIEGTIPAAEIDFQNQTTTVQSGVATVTIKAFAVTSDKLYRAVVVPQTATLLVTVKTADGKSRSAEFASKTLLQGKIYTVGLVVEADALIPTLSGEIEDWEPGGDLTPDDGGSGGGDTGDDNTVVCQGETYKIAQYGDLIWMTESLRYIPSGEALSNGTWYPDGNSDATVVKSYGMLYDFKTASGLCPAGWRLPTSDDFTALLAVLKEPYTDFLLHAGVYLLNQQSFKYFDKRGLLMGSTFGGETDTHKYCKFETTILPEVVDYVADSGVSVRCVTDVK